MKNKLPLIVLVVFVAFTSVQMSFAAEEYAEIISYSTSDNETSVDAGSVSASINGGGDLVISVYNAYPSYEAYVDFTIENTDEEVTLYLSEILINNVYSGVEMDVAVTYFDGTPIPIDTELAPGATMDCLVTITILPAALEDESYSFSIDLNFDSD